MKNYFFAWSKFGAFGVILTMQLEPPKILVQKLLDQFFTFGSSILDVFEPHFFDIVITENDHHRYVKHVLGGIYVFFSLIGYFTREPGGGGSPKGLVNNMLM